MPHKKLGWESPRASLIVTKPDLAPEVVDAALEVRGKAVDMLRVEAVSTDESTRVYQPLEKSPAVERQLLDLANELLPMRGALEELLGQGYHMRMEISGFVKTNSVCSLEASTLALVQQLGVPLSFTTRVARGEDDSDWLESVLD
ncbi:hypothetical protein [Streptomyces sp. NPDC046261]|uniref:hypothetical protein n=1 Tax=Streptomyces sp. NPDC046261 TaxID=3157200 RepID=UPI0033CF61E8